MSDVEKFKEALKKLFEQFKLFNNKIAPGQFQSQEHFERATAKRRYLLLAAAVEVILDQLNNDMFDTMGARMKGFFNFQAPVSVASAALVLAHGKLKQAARSLS